MATHPSILLIEDSPGECELFSLALAQTGLSVALHTEQDAEAAFHFLESQWTAPAPIQSYSLDQNRSPGEASGVVSTARIERGPSQAARSASTETMPVASPSPARGSVARAQDQAGVVHSMPSTSTETLPPTSHSSTSISIPEGDLNRSPIARVQRGPSEGARCASTGDRSGLPSLILLDLHLRGQDGCDLLKRLRSDPRFTTIPFVIFTTSDDQHDLARCYSCGANGYVIKPGTFAELVHCTQDICHYWLNRNRTPYMDMTDTPC